MSIKSKFRLLVKYLKGRNDPAKYCTYHLERGCVHVDGMLCKFPHCSLFKKYYKEKIMGLHWGSCFNCRHTGHCSLPGYGEGCDTHYQSKLD